MNKFFLFAIIICGCSLHKYNYDIVRKTKSQKLTPPGTVWLKDNLFIDETEVSNFSWLEFVYWQRWHNKLGNENYNLLPDTNCWDRFDLLNSYNLKIYYLRHPAYKNYPVVGISYEQAVEYCKWRSMAVNQHIYTTRDKLKNYPIDTLLKTPEYVRYRLPTKEEWEYAASAGLNFCDYPMGYEKLIDKNNIPVSNTLEYFDYFTNTYKNTSYQCGDTMEVVYPTKEVYFGKTNKYGLYNMLGNVSELVKDSLVKGLNYYTPIFEIQPEHKNSSDSIINYHYQSKQIYNYKINKKYIQPEPWIGFRCICEVIEK